MDNNALLLFSGSVFITVFLLSQVLIIPAFGTDKKQRKQLNNRFEKLLLSRDGTHQQILKNQYLDQLNPLTRILESTSVMGKLKLFLEQAGSNIPAYRFLLISLMFCIATTYIVWLSFFNPTLAVITLAISLYIPYFWLQKKRKSNLDKFEEQLPEALQMFSRCLKTGYPFNESMKIISEEMPDPIGHEFGLVFEEVNFGRNLEMAFALMLERFPSLSLSAMATSILIQKQTGGNMSEILLKIANVLRSRFKLQRKIKTLSAEGVLAAWVLCLMPFLMYLAMTWLNPDYFKTVLEHPKGMMLFYAIGMFEVIAVFWMRIIINIDV
ncbi:MAG: type II secretion system F family protein [Methylococcales bacterium]